MMNQWINGLLGLAIIAVPFMSLSGTVFAWTLATVGLVISVSSFLAMLTDPEELYTYRVEGHT